MGISFKHKREMAEAFLEFVRFFSPKKGEINSIIAQLTTKYLRSAKETAFKDGIIFSGRVARFFLDQLAALKSENKALRGENLHLKNELLDYRHAKVKSDHLEAENRSMSEQLSRLQLLLLLKF